MFWCSLHCSHDVVENPAHSNPTYSNVFLAFRTLQLPLGQRRFFVRCNVEICNRASVVVVVVVVVVVEPPCPNSPSLPLLSSHKNLGGWSVFPVRFLPQRYVPITPGMQNLAGMVLYVWCSLA